MSISKLFVISVFGLNVLAPATALAVEDKPLRPDQSAKVAATRPVDCAGFENLSGRLKGNFDDRHNKVKQNRATNKETLAARRDEAQTKIKAARENAAKKRSENLAKLLEKATTDEQKTAVRTYQVAVAAAVDARQAAYDQAHLNFKNGLQALIDANKVTNDNALATLKSAIEIATAKAKAACSVEGADKQAVHNQLKIDIKAAQDAFRVTHKNADKVGGQIKPLIDARKAAHTAANEAFKVAMDSAKTALKAAFST